MLPGPGVPGIKSATAQGAVALPGRPGAEVQVTGDRTAAAELQAKLSEIGAAIAGVEAREANIRAGYVYVISNIGAFGPNMVKIGMARREN